ncbi:MAG TPA: peptidylprolyl isomerase [Synergistaceae bacterium]|jgi:peptidyl-prolyl cis-trans isomerase C|nr:peptidylprolyl isomerase [Synergistaceae bacterium]
MTRLQKSTGALVAILLLAAAAAGVAETKAPASKDVTPEAAQKQVQDGEKVMAKVDGTEIKLKDVREIIAQLDPQRAAMYDNEMGYRAVLEEMISLEVFARRGEELGVEKDPDFVKSMEGIRKELLRRFAVDKTLKDVTVTDQEVKEYYDKNKDRFTTPESVRASHILVSDDVEMKKVQDELKGGMSFEDAAKKYSTCPSKEKGGDLGYFSKGQMVAEFEQAAFAMKPGETSTEPVKTQFGLHLIKVVEKKEASVRSLDEVKDQIKETVLTEKQGKLYQDELAKLREKYKVEIVEEKKPEPAADAKPASGDVQPEKKEPAAK